MCPRPDHSRNALTLVELLIAVAITSLMAAAMGALARGVQISSTYGDGVATATQHARVALERIQRTVSGATANANFQGAAVFYDAVAGQSLPDTLVVWHPSGAAANPTGLPLFSELVVYCFNPASPNQLLEITSPGDNRTVPALSDTADWTTNLAAMKTGTNSTLTLLTDLMRTATETSIGTSTAPPQIGCVRFGVELHPTAAQWTAFQAGSLAWSNMSWAQGICGSAAGLAQTNVRVELQMLPGYTAVSDSQAQQVIPFLGSAAFNYQLQQ